MSRANARKAAKKTPPSKERLEASEIFSRCRETVRMGKYLISVPKSPDRDFAEAINRDFAKRAVSAAGKKAKTRAMWAASDWATNIGCLVLHDNDKWGKPAPVLVLPLDNIPALLQHACDVYQLKSEGHGTHEESMRAALAAVGIPTTRLARGKGAT